MTSVLLVDPSPEFLRALERSLSRCDFQLAVATTKATASSMIESLAPEVLLAEVNLPDGHGFELLERSRAVRGDVHGVLMAAVWTAEDRAEALLQGARYVLEKPFRPPELIAALHPCAERCLRPIRCRCAIDLLRAANQQGVTARLVEVAGSGFVDLVGGELVHAQWEGVVGESALVPLLGTELRMDGTPAGDRTIFDPFRVLVLRVLREIESFETRVPTVARGRH